jgi:hypothetical protein
MTWTTVKMLTQMYLCVAVFTFAIICYLLTQKIDQLFTVCMHVNLVHKCVEKKVESGFTHRRQCQSWGVRGELIRGYTQQIRVCSLQLGRGPCSLLHVCACTHAL